MNKTRIGLVIAVLVLIAIVLFIWWNYESIPEEKTYEEIELTTTDTINGDLVVSGEMNPADSIAETYLGYEEISPEEIIDRRFTYAGKPFAENYPNPLTLLYNDCFALAYDEVRGCPAWVAYRVFHVEDYSTDPRPSRFLIDGRTENRISHDHYTRSGYDRGHMAPNFAISSRYGVDCQRQTFMMTNIIPQRPSLNRNWWQRLERLIARDYSEKYDNVWVITGPVFMEEGNWIGSKVKIPCHNFKIITVEKEGHVKIKAFLVNQEVGGGEDHLPYLTTVREIEALTGLNFNPLWDEVFADSLENLILQSMWN